ncbi:MAG: acyl-ACP--UDP-N-acetylglucosamine O-acyltransferase [bacterium]
MSIHPSAIIGDGAKISDNVDIGAYSIISSETTIGSFTRIDDGVLIDGRTTIGNNCRIFHGCAIGCPPQDLKYSGEETDVVIGDNNVIREFVTIHRGTKAKGTTEIGNGNLIMAYVHIAHDCTIGNNCIIANSSALAGHIIIDDFAIIGGLVPIHQFCRVGKYAMVGGMSRITKDVIPFSLVAGNPPRVYGLNTVGLNRHKFRKERINILEQTFNILFRSGLNITQALQKIDVEIEKTEDILYLTEFIKSSQRGIIIGLR